jgi:outer membrane receptor protein involved in Fe transport
MKPTVNARRAIAAMLAVVALAVPLHAQGPSPARSTTVTGTVLDGQNAVTLPGVLIEVVGRSETAHTDVDGRFSLVLPPGEHELRVGLDGYQERRVKVVASGERTLSVDVSLSMAAFSEVVEVRAEMVEAATSSAEAQLVERKNAQVITDNMGAKEMRANGDSDAAAAMQRVTGLSVVDNQYVFVRGLGERYSNTTLAGSVIPTTEPDKKVVPLDLFPAGLVDSVQVAKSYSPDKSAEFAGGLVQIVPLKFPRQPVLDLAYEVSAFSTATGKAIPVSPLDGRDFWGFDNGARAIPDGFPDDKIVRRGIYTPSVGYPADQITSFGRQLENRWSPVEADGAPGQTWGVVFGDRFGNLGVVASMRHSYKEQYVEEQRRFYRVAEGDELEAVSDYAMQYGTQKAQLGIVGSLAYKFTDNHRVTFENFYTHSGRDEGRVFEGPNTENNFRYRNYRVQFIEEGLLSNALSGEHFLPRWGNSRLDWRASIGRATRDEPDLREVLYQAPLSGAGLYLLADESQSGFRMFNELDDDTLDLAVNWNVFSTAGGRATHYKFGVSYVDRTREFTSRRFRFIPISGNTGGSLSSAFLSQTPEQLYVPENIGTAFRFNEETRPVDAYDGAQNTASFYGMVDMAVTNRLRLAAGARVEAFDQEVNTFDPFGLFQARVTAKLENTDVFPGVNVVYALRPDMNFRVGYSTTVNRPEFRELAAYEFTDVVGSRAVRGNPDLQRALIQNVDGRWEMFSGSRGVLAASVFYKYFDSPIERVVIAGAQPVVTFQNAEKANNFGVELEAGRELFKGLFVSANYTYVDSKITLAPDQRTVQTSQERPLAGQSQNLFNLIGEYAIGGFAARVLYNFIDDRISDVGSNGAPDVVEQGRGSLDVVITQRIGRGLALRLNLENLTDAEYVFKQGVEDQRLYKLGRAVGLGVSYSVF